MIRREDGFTLVEAMIAFALLTMGLMAATMSFVAISRLQTKGTTSRDVQQNSRYVLESVVRDIRSSSFVTVNGNCMVLSSAQNKVTTYYYVAATSSLMKVESASGSCNTGGTRLGGTVQVTAANFTLVTPPSGSLQYVKVGLVVKQPAPGLSVTDPFAYEYHLDTTVAPRSL